MVLALLVAGCSKSGTEASAPVAVAPGDSITAAAPASVGMTITGEIKKDATASQFYRFDNPGKLRDIVMVRLENKSATLRPDIKIYNAERSQIFEKYDGTPGANVEQPVSLDPGQSIYVEVLPYSSSGAYQLSALAQKAYDVNEPNDDQLHPTTLNFGSSIEGSVMDDKDSDWFHVTAPSSGKVTIALENLSATLRPDVKVYSAAKSQLIEKYDGTPGAGLDFTVDLQPGQDFYVQIVPYGSVGKYRLTTRAAVLAADMAGALQAKGLVDLYGIYFDTDQAFVKPESANTLTEVANLLKSDPTLRLEVAGHTDNSGTADHNQKLSQDRATAVVAALAGQFGIDAGRLVAKGYGDSKPVAANDTPDNMAKNRRVELRKI
jgi:outer membrane protein OmpA-like peptidoglycan-associated protein